MLNPVELEQTYCEFMKNLRRWLPDGIIDVDLFLLKEFDLLGEDDEDENENILQSQFPFYFHVVETADKVTLFNNQFAVWIVPKVIQGVPTTLTLISLVEDETDPKLEIVFTTSGIYNTPKTVLKVLRYFLTEVIDTEAVIQSIGRSEGA
ncbi:MAG: hypothetical protein MRY21_05000 [Simkaniaceae bacterium]|nr:hypothetical protein [Simkaniaceae bacterium]